MKISLVLEKNGSRHEGPVVDMTYSGCAVLLPQSETNPVREFESLGVTFLSNAEILASTRGIVRYLRATKISGNTFLRVGLEMDPVAASISAEERRKKSRFALKEFYQPFATALHPFFSNETLLFKVLEFSENGLALVTAARNSSLLLGLTLTFRVQNPFGDWKEITGVVQNIKPVEGNRLRLGVALSQDAGALLTEFSTLLLLGSTAVSLKAFKEANAKENNATEHFEVKRKDFSEDHAILLAHRQAHEASFDKKAEETASDKDFSATETGEDDQDASALHIGLTHKNTIVATARLVEGTAALGPSEAANRGAHIPSWLAKKGYVECNRMAFHPDFRSAETVSYFLNEVGLNAAEAGHRYLLLCCDVPTSRLANRAGFEEVGVFDDLTHARELRVLVLDTQTLTQRKNLRST